MSTKVNILDFVCDKNDNGSMECHGYVSKMQGAAGRPSTRNTVLFAVFIVLLLYVIYIVFFGSSSSKSNMHSTPVRKYKWTLYKRNSCPWCVKQMKALEGFDISDVNIVDCEKTHCDVKGLPSWHNNQDGKHMEGFQTPDKLVSVIGLKKKGV